MNRVDFMNQLESLLQSISLTEREEAIQYYNDYFDDAGEENEQEVIEALGNPARVAENIKRDLAGNSYGEAAKKVKASDRVLMEYGKGIPEGSDEPESARQQGKESDGSSGSGIEAAETASGNGSAGHTAGGNGQGTGAASSEYGRRSGYTASGYGQDSSGASESGTSGSWSQGTSGSGTSGSWSQGTSGSGTSDSWSQGTSGSGTSGNWSRNASDSGTSGAWNQDTSGYREYKPQKRKKGEGMPAWAIAMLVTILVIASPVLGGVALGIAGVLIGGIAGWFSLILGFGVASVVLLVLTIVFAVVGILCVFVSPWAGMALLGGALLCGGIGLLCLMLTVAMAGIATPAIFRGIAFVFRGFRKKRAKAY